MKNIIIIGAGPAGLTAAFELLKHSKEVTVTILEETNDIGGICKTVNYKGNRMDMGGHRFFSKSPKVNDWWEKMLPMQAAAAFDDRVLGRKIPLAAQGPDPEKEDRVMLTRQRVSRIYFDGKFYDYPISMKPETFRNMGFFNTIRVGCSYLAAMLHKRPEDNLENFYINRFGKKLYAMFFEYYTENLWGRHPSEIDASWGAQRVKGISITAILKDMFGKLFHKKNRKVETSLIEEFKYPKLGPGELWEITASEIEKLGGTVLKNAKAVKLLRNTDGTISHVIYEKDGVRTTLNADIVISSMPVKDLVAGLTDVPAEPARIAAGLPYRDYMTLGVLVPKLKLQNRTNRKTIGNIVPDDWIYVQDRTVKLGRIQIYNNWSPYMVKDLEHTVWIGLEYFVQEGDDFWNMSEEAFSKFGIEEMIKIGLIDRADEVLDTHMEKVKKAYPAYFDTYDEMDTLVDYLNTIDNLYCVGRNGQHRYNNMDHSMETSFEAVNNILNNRKDKQNIWAVNTDKEYHEEEHSDGK